MGYESQKVADLKEECKKRGLSVTGKKSDLCARLTAHDAAATNEGTAVVGTKDNEGAGVEPAKVENDVDASVSGGEKRTREEDRVEEEKKVEEDHVSVPVVAEVVAEAKVVVAEKEKVVHHEEREEEKKGITEEKKRVSDQDEKAVVSLEPSSDAEPEFANTSVQHNNTNTKNIATPVVSVDTLFVSGLQRPFKEDLFREYLSNNKASAIVDWWMNDPVKSCAIVKFDCADTADAVLKRTNGVVWPKHGKALDVEYATTAHFQLKETPAVAAPPTATTSTSSKRKNDNTRDTPDDGVRIVRREQSVEANPRTLDVDELFQKTAFLPSLYYTSK
jgi:hypothetical protein